MSCRPPSGQTAAQNARPKKSANASGSAKKAITVPGRSTVGSDRAATTFWIDPTGHTQPLR
jgi:hypothetical protein